MGTLASIIMLYCGANPVGEFYTMPHAMMRANLELITCEQAVTIVDMKENKIVNWDKEAGEFRVFAAEARNRKEPPPPPAYPCPPLPGETPATPTPPELFVGERSWPLPR
jgi:hypothetical protein